MNFPTYTGVLPIVFFSLMGALHMFATTKITLLHVILRMTKDISLLLSCRQSAFLFDPALPAPEILDMHLYIVHSLCNIGPVDTCMSTGK